MGAVQISVTSGGSDTPTATRPQTLATGGDYTSEPFATLAAAVAHARRRRPFAAPVGDEDITIAIEAGTFAGATIDGFDGPGTLTVQGTYSAATLASGAQTGTAGAGTSATQLNKPAAAANWTADDLENRFVRLTSGGGAPAVRPIISNTTTALTVESITGMDATSVFEVVEPGTLLSSDIDIADCSMRVRVEAIGLAAGDDLTISNSRNATVDGCLLTSTGSLTITDCATANVTNAIGNGTSVAIDIERCNNALLDHVQLDGGALLNVVSAQYVLAQIEARNALATPVTLKACGFCQVGVSSNDNTGAGCLLDGCHFVESSGTGFVGSGNSTYGLDVQGPSWVDATGATITGTTNDFRCGATVDSWTNLATEVSYIDLGSSIHIPGG